MVHVLSTWVQSHERAVDVSDNWQRRWQPLLSQWVLISARSAVRPWSGAVTAATSSTLPSHDPDCYLCPGVTRANGTKNPDYVGEFAFDNDFPSLSFEAPDAKTDTPLRSTAPAFGTCRVLCWSEKHDTTLANLSSEQIRRVARLWQSEYRTLSAQPAIANVLIFENKGVEIGVSNLHPHGQVYASSFVSDTASRMRAAQVEYAAANNGNSLLQCLLAEEHTQRHLIIEQAESFSVIVPFAARFAFETWIVPHRHVSSLNDMSDQELDELAHVYQRQVRRYDMLFNRSAPNITLLHNAPCDEQSAAQNRQCCFHLAFQPPLRDQDKLKFLAGFEAGSNNVVNPVQPEQAAEQMRAINPDNWR